jgi:hypothetical protein
MTLNGVRGRGPRPPRPARRCASISRSVAHRSAARGPSGSGPDAPMQAHLEACHRAPKSTGFSSASPAPAPHPRRTSPPGWWRGRSSPPAAEGSEAAGIDVILPFRPPSLPTLTEQARRTAPPQPVVDESRRRRRRGGSGRRAGSGGPGRHDRDRRKPHARSLRCDDVGRLDDRGMDGGRGALPGERLRRDAGPPRGGNRAMKVLTRVGSHGLRTAAPAPSSLSR